jgi:peptide/nickel transport system substrate-binding protein
MRLSETIKRSIWLGIFFVIVSIPLCTQFLIAAQPKQQYGGTLRVSDTFEGVSIGYPPKMTKTAFATRQIAPAIETLLRIDKAGIPVPWLASAFKEDAKARTITLTLRKGVKFHDGTDFNADAVKWNLQQHITAKTQGTERIKSVDVVDNSKVRINLSDWDSTVTGGLTQYFGMIISPASYMKNGEEWCEKNPVGTGPFQFVSWEKGVRTTYKKFPGYWQKGKPYLDSIEHIPIQDTQSREFSLRKGEVDLMIRMSAKSVAGLEKDGFVITRVRGGSGAVSLVPDSANANSPFAKLKVRQAVAYAIDKAAIVKTVLFGESVPADQQISKGNWAYNPDIKGYPYNPAKAKQLLSEAGYPNGFKTKLLYIVGPEYDQIFTAVQGYLKNIDIDVELDPAQMGRHTQTIWQGGKWDGLVMTQPSPNPDVLVLLGPFYGGSGKSLVQMLVPDDYAQTIRDAVAAPNFKIKQQWTWEALKLMIDKYAMTIPIYFNPDFTAKKGIVHNDGMCATPHTGLWTPEDAWIER